MNVFGSHASLIVHLSSFSRSDPVLFPYQSRFNSDLSPFFLSLALGKEGGICGRETGVLLDLNPISLLWLLEMIFICYILRQNFKLVFKA